jgi:hypothetical protein
LKVPKLRNVVGLREEDVARPEAGGADSHQEDGVALVAVLVVRGVEAVVVQGVGSLLGDAAVADSRLAVVVVPGDAVAIKYGTMGFCTKLNYGVLLIDVRHTCIA